MSIGESTAVEAFTAEGDSIGSSKRPVGAGDEVRDARLDETETDGWRSEREGRSSGVARGVDAVDADLASRMAPPDVTRGFGSCFLPQNDHLPFLSSPSSLAASVEGCSGSPNRDRANHGSALTCEPRASSGRRGRRDAVSVDSNTDALGDGLGRAIVV